MGVTVERRARDTLAAMGAWYWIGVSAGLGAAAGVLVAGVAARVVVAAIVDRRARGVGLGFAIDAWQPGSCRRCRRRSAPAGSPPAGRGA